jgi:hypothetical protein
MADWHEDLRQLLETEKERVRLSNEQWVPVFGRDRVDRLNSQDADIELLLRFRSVSSLVGDDELMYLSGHSSFGRGRRRVGFATRPRFIVGVKLNEAIDTFLKQREQS